MNRTVIGAFVQKETLVFEPTSCVSKLENCSQSLRDKTTFSFFNKESPNGTNVVNDGF